MESANNHHHQVVGSSCYGVGTTPHPWSTTTPTSLIEPMSSSRLQEHTLLPLQYDPNVDDTQDLSFHDWANNNQSIQDLQQLPRIKEELSDHYYRKYADLLNSDEQNKVLPGDHWLYSSSGRGYNQVFPSNMNQMDMNLEALDLLTSSSFSGNLGACSQNYNQIGILRDHEFSYGALDMQRQSHQVRLYDTDKISDPIGRLETKRGSNKTKPKAPYQNATRKSSRASCPPFKVRKEKLGDRIAALQQLVAPFGKTDTASVLMEAIGYIKFLQDQVETLSVPYMKASRNKSAVKEGIDDHQNEKDGEEKRDLKSRGLCLVPLSCLSYVTDGGAAVVWPPPHFGGPAGHLASNFSV